MLQKRIYWIMGKVSSICLNCTRKVKQAKQKEMGRIKPVSIQRVSSRRQDKEKNEGRCSFLFSKILVTRRVRN